MRNLSHKIKTRASPLPLALRVFGVYGCSKGNKAATSKELTK